MSLSKLRSRLGNAWPWIFLGLLTVPAIWHWVDFPEDVDPEFPAVIRPTYSLRPPPAYRLAEPGDTIDRIAIYASALCVTIALRGYLKKPGSLWQTAWIISLAALWYSATPGPTFDGWHGYGFRTVLDNEAPTYVRWAIGLGATMLGLLAILPVLKGLALAKLIPATRDPRTFGLIAVATVLVVARQFEIPGIEPVGYWPRWFFVWGLFAFLVTLVLNSESFPKGFGRRAALMSVVTSLFLGMTYGAVGMSWYHRPLLRMRTVETGKIYISAMPTYRGLKIAQERHHFKTIINVFDESTHQRSPLLEDEIRFCKENNIRYLGNPPGAVNSDIFLDETFKIAQDPNAWPILVHCHGCMDRSPAWMGMYRFLVQNRPLDAIFREIEGHRGYRPKASVTLLYNRVLPARAPERFANDKTAQAMIGYANGVYDPYYDNLPDLANPAETTRLSMGNPGQADSTEIVVPPPVSDLPKVDLPDEAAILPNEPDGPVPPPIGEPNMNPETPLSVQAIRTSFPAISVLMQTALANPGLVSLAAGFVDQASLPTEITSQVAAKILADPVEGRRAMQYGTTPGDIGLRKQLLLHQEKTDGVAEGTYAHLLPRTIVTTGSAQLLYMVSEALLNEGDIVLVEAPTYFVYLGNVECRGAVAIGVETDAGGLSIDALDATLAKLEAEGKLARVKLIYSVTEHSNPTGISLAAERRQELIDLAKRWSKSHKITILDDAAYRGLTFEEIEPPTLWSHDSADEYENVVLARSFSKTFSPGVKTGYGILPTDLAEALIRIKGNHDFGSSNFHQLILERVLLEGHYDRHLAELITMYRSKRAAFLAALDTYLKPLDDGLTWTRGVGGLFVWLTVPSGLDTGRRGPLFQACLDRGVIYVPGEYCFSNATGPVPTNHARLSFGVATEADLVEGVKRLGLALADCLERV